MVVLDACGFHAVIGIKVLVQKALITVYGGRFDMHDLIQKMGHYIVRGEHPNNPEKHSRIWQGEDIQSIYAMDAMQENDNIEAVRYFGSLCYPPPSIHKVVSNMKKLRWISWYRYAARSLPTKFQPAKLCYLQLERSLLEQLWEGYKHLPLLKVLDLQYSVNLIKTPDFSGLPCLERLILTGCTELKELHPSIGYHKRLIFLAMANCINLKTFQPIIKMKNLEILTLTRGSQLYKFPRFLRILNLSNCHLEDGDIPSDICELCKLQELDISRNNFSRLHSVLLQLPLLKYLNLSGCDRLVELPDLPSSIAVLDASYCESLEFVGDVPTNYKWLWKVSLERKNKLIGGETILESMLQGNAIEYYFMSLYLGDVGVSRSFEWDVFRLKLPRNWDNDFSGFLLTVVVGNVVDIVGDGVDIVMKHEMHMDYQPQICETRCHETRMCYISFGSLRHTSWWNST